VSGHQDSRVLRPNAAQSAYVIRPRSVSNMFQAGPGTWVDTGGRLSGTPTFTPNAVGGSGGWSLSLTGGWSATDPFDAPHIIFPPMQGFNLNTCFAVGMEIMERTPPDLSSDITIIAGICSENADSGTIQAVFHALLYSGASRAGRRGQVAAGVASSSTGVANASIRSVSTVFWKNGEGSSAVWQSSQGRCGDASHTPIGAATLSNVDYRAVAGDAAPRPFISVLRGAAVDVTTRAFAFDVRFTDPMSFDMVL
jgi:hypothetical protein